LCFSRIGRKIMDSNTQRWPVKYSRAVRNENSKSRRTSGVATQGKASVPYGSQTYIILTWKFKVYTLPCFFFLTWIVIYYEMINKINLQITDVQSKKKMPFIRRYLLQKTNKNCVYYYCSASILIVTGTTTYD
jgi:hypothetical protein